MKENQKHNKYLRNVLSSLTIKLSLDDIISVEPFYSEEFNREYTVYKVITPNKTFVLKKTNLNEIHIYKILEKIELDITPKLLCSQKINDEFWIFIDYVTSSSPLLKKDMVLDLAKKLAQLHRCFKILSKGNDEILSEIAYCDLSKLTDYLHGGEYQDDEIKVISQAIENLNSSAYTLVHGDMIPLNVICNTNSIKMIDWEHGQIGPYVMDLGRLLGDFKRSASWINSNWEQELLEVYRDEYFTTPLSIAEANTYYRDYYSAKLTNYVKVIATYIKNNHDKDEWFYINRRQVGSVIMILKQFQC